MSIASYTDLKSKIARFLARSGLDADIADAITMFETRYNSEEENFFAEQAYTISTVAGTATVALPPDFNAHVSLSVRGRGDLPVVAIGVVNAQPVTQGQPTQAAFYPGNLLKLSPVPDGVYTLDLIYEANLAPLGDATATNWMLQKYPFVYLYGALMFMLDMLQDGVRAETIETRYKSFLGDIQGKKTAKKLGKTPVMQAGRNLP